MGRFLRWRRQYLFKLYWVEPYLPSNHEGAAFPLGTYMLTVTAKGKWDGPGSCDAGAFSVDGGAVLDYRVTAERFIMITP
jgi:hypothetical protein